MCWNNKITQAHANEKAYYEYLTWIIIFEELVCKASYAFYIDIGCFVCKRPRIPVMIASRSTRLTFLKMHEIIFTHVSHRYAIALWYLHRRWDASKSLDAWRGLWNWHSAIWLYLFIHFFLVYFVKKSYTQENNWIKFYYKHN